MINRWLRRLRKRNGRGSSLYIGLLTSLLLGLVLAVVSYILLQSLTHYYIVNRYATAERQAQRRTEYLAELQEFVSASGLSSEDTAGIAGWARSRPYTYLMIYKDDQLFFTSDMEPEEDNTPESPEQAPPEEGGEDIPEEGEGGPSEGEAPEEGGSDEGAEGEGGKDDENGDGASEPEDENGGSQSGNNTQGGGSQSGNTQGGGSQSGNTQGGGNGGDSWLDGITSPSHDREQLMAEAQANGLHPIELSDGTLFAAVTEYSQELYYNLMNVISFAMAAIVLTVVLVTYQRRVIARIKRLESDVTVVSHFDMNHRIVPEGRDEISRLSANVETMRNSMLENIESERRAHEANTDLVTSISHDIRTPLTVLLGYLDMMRSCEGNGEAMQSYIAASERTAMRLKELADDMFKYSLAYGDTGSAVTLEEYDAATLTEQLLAENVLLLEEGGYSVDFDVDPNACPEGEVVFTSAPSLMRIVDNLFSNIRKYADKEKTVSVSVKRVKHSLVITVKNYISGEKREVESNGIGLKTCARLAALVTEGFGYRELGETFEATMSVKIGKAGSFRA